MEPCAVGVSASSWRVLDHDWVRKSISESCESHRLRSPSASSRRASPSCVRDNPEEDRLEDLFDEVEYLMGLACAHHVRQGTNRKSCLAFVGCQTDFPAAVIDRHKELLVIEGVFEDTEQFAETWQRYDSQIRSRGWSDDDRWIPPANPELPPRWSRRPLGSEMLSPMNLFGLEGSSPAPPEPATGESDSAPLPSSSNRWNQAMKIQGIHQPRSNSTIQRGAAPRTGR